MYINPDSCTNHFNSIDQKISISFLSHFLSVLAKHLFFSNIVGRELVNMEYQWVQLPPEAGG